MAARDEILARLRHAPPETVPLPDTPRVGAVSDLVSVFIERSTAVGTEVETVTPDILAGAIVDELIKSQARRVAMWEDRLLTQVRARLRAEPFEVMDPSDHERETLARADVGITIADFGIAFTGTLALDCSPSHPRSTSLVPPLHLAVLPGGHIVGTLADVLARSGPLPSALTFITGPSRTADIELTPVRGAHGPTRVKVYLLT